MSDQNVSMEEIQISQKELDGLFRNYRPVEKKPASDALKLIRALHQSRLNQQSSEFSNDDFDSLFKD